MNTSSKPRIVLLASGSGSLAQAIFDGVTNHQIDAQILAIISDKDSPALTRGSGFSIDRIYLPMTADRMEWNAKLHQTLTSLHPDLIISVGFMRILPPHIVHDFRIINTHPALLPHFPGAHAVRDALTAGATTTGCTIHWVDEGVDTGTIIAQREVPILESDNESTLHERIKIVERTMLIEELPRILASLAHQSRES